MKDMHGHLLKDFNRSNVSTNPYGSPTLAERQRAYIEQHREEVVANAAMRQRHSYGM